MTYEQIVERKRKLIKKHQTELTELLKECPHTNIELKNQYYTSTYYDPSYTEYWNECTCCHERGPVTTSKGGYG